MLGPSGLTEESRVECRMLSVLGAFNLCQICTRVHDIGTCHLLLHSNDKAYNYYFKLIFARYSYIKLNRADLLHQQFSVLLLTLEHKSNTVSGKCSNAFQTLSVVRQTVNRYYFSYANHHKNISNRRYTQWWLTNKSSYMADIQCPCF